VIRIEIDAKTESVAVGCPNHKPGV
jgi:hypothetical protein